MEFTLTDKEFVLFKRLIYKKSGIKSGRLGRELLVSRLSRRLKELGVESFQDYHKVVIKSDLELTNLIDSITTNKTGFFREPHHFEFLKRVILPEVSASETKRLRVWCAGCSTGEEPYSTAITVCENIREPELLDVKILASDISTRVLEKAEQGIYPEGALSIIHPLLLKRYFLVGLGQKRGLYQVKERLQAMVIFKRINLMSEEYPIRGQFDIIFCRNVVIYFDREGGLRVIRSLANFLSPGGYMFCGHSESLTCMDDSLKMISPCIYKKVQP